MATIAFVGTVTGSVAETYNVTDGMTLTLKVDDGDEQTVTFEDADFSTPSAATAPEVGAAITAKTVGVLSDEDVDKVRITSTQSGPSSRIEITGGTITTPSDILGLVDKEGDGVDASGGQPSASQRACKFVANLGTDYATHGWDVSSALPAGSTVKASPYVLMYNGAALRHARVEMIAGVARLVVYDDDNGAPGQESATADQSGNKGIEIIAHVE